MATIDESVRNDFRIGDTLSKTFSILFSKFIPLTVLVLIFHVPILLWSLSTGLLVDSIENPELMAQNIDASFFWIILFSTVLSLASAAAVTYAVFLEITGRKINIGECLSKSISVLVPVVLAELLSYLIVTIGTILLIIPGIFAILVLFVVLPVVVVEQPGIFKSLSRSAELTKGNRWPC